jgi:hypothetical protein
VFISIAIDPVAINPLRDFRSEADFALHQREELPYNLAERNGRGDSDMKKSVRAMEL